jgi:hypothetical protein
MRKTSRLYSVNAIVYAVKNSAWGRRPMRIVEDKGDGWFSCEHPTMGRGAFHINTLMLGSSMSTERKRKIRTLRVAEHLAEKLLKELFE